MKLARWHSGTKAQTLLVMRNGGIGLQDVSDSMAWVEDTEDVKNWDICISKCRICGGEQVDIVPHEMIGLNTECNNCGNMTADVIEQEDD